MSLVIDNRIFIGLGSNLTNSPENLARAVQLLQERLKTKIIASSLYFSEPVEVLEQPWFFNQVAFFEAAKEHTPTMILGKLQQIEQEMGRVHTYRYGPRIIDLDLLLFKNWVFESDSLIIPHPKIEERLFVLAPLLELDPALFHPRFNRSFRQILDDNQPRLSRCEIVK
ncbi:MAG TPA: 2-amino-4-hydroxy-6-hydroxymethyldihydropteridine diphosphokinase [Firmicutes bacterium]|nr:2-amino-4-hydroxy-6-hydroxymethyldihydropteridine diphosphokinase [Bacillota bacterium]